jgi:hypothetical protein
MIYGPGFLLEFLVGLKYLLSGNLSTKGGYENGGSRIKDCGKG